MRDFRRVPLTLTLPLKYISPNFTHLSHVIGDEVGDRGRESGHGGGGKTCHLLGCHASEDHAHFLNLRGGEWWKLEMGLGQYQYKSRCRHLIFG